MAFYFAWVDQGQGFDSSVLREDETVFAFDLDHREGQIPTLTIDIKNPKVGLLAPGRKQWAWLSWSDPTSGAVTPIFHGWLVGLPSNLLAEIVTLQLIARPTDFLAQKQLIANGLMVSPWYDPIWIDQTKLTDPDTILETYTRAWHVDRVTNQVTISELINGEDGTEEFRQAEAFYDSVSISFAQSPATQVAFTGTVKWTQAYTGYLKLPKISLSAWNGQQIINDWPKPGDNLGSGWTVYDSTMTNWRDQSLQGSIPVTGSNGQPIADNSSNSGSGGGSGGGAGSGAGGGGGGSGSGTSGGNVNSNAETQNIPPEDFFDPGGGSEDSLFFGLDQGGIDKIQKNDFYRGYKSGLPKISLAWSFSVHWKNTAKTHHDGDVMSVDESGTYDSNGLIGEGLLIGESMSIQEADPSTGTPGSDERHFTWRYMEGEPQKPPAGSPKTNPKGSGTGPNPSMPAHPASCNGAPTTGGVPGGEPAPDGAVTTTYNDINGTGPENTTPPLTGTMTLMYELSRPHTETVNFVMNSAIQPIVVIAPDEGVNQISLSLSSSDLGLLNDFGGAMPIRNPAREFFFTTDRGQLAIQYPLLLARAHLVQAARAVKVSFECTFERALALSCRKNALIHDPRLPGGSVIGKVTEYHIKVDGDKGSMIGQVQIESVIGTGDSVIATEGTPVWVDNGYVSIGYQYYDGSSFLLPSNDAAIFMPPTEVQVQGLALPLSYRDAVMVYQVHPGSSMIKVNADGTATALPTWIELALIPVTGQKFETDYWLGSPTLVMPKTIDLAAVSNA